MPNTINMFSILVAFVMDVMAKEFIGGDESGWTNDFHAWAKDKVFHVRDRLGKFIVIIFSSNGEYDA